jgi:AraC-like DNA-binding protein
MPGRRRLYERAAKTTSERPLWHVERDAALFAGSLHHNALHAHSVSVFLAGLYGSFSLRLEEGAWLNCRTAVIPASVAYEFDMRGEPLSVLYLEPNIGGTHALTPLVCDAREADGALIGRQGQISVLRELYEDAHSRRWASLALRDLVAFSDGRSRRPIDARISQALAALYRNCCEQRPVADFSRAAGLSPSHFQHLFTQEIGVPFRRYRIWQRLRAAIAEIVDGSNFTQAAHVAGFYDQAHFARDFRGMFGAPASPTLAHIR